MVLMMLIALALTLAASVDAAEPRPLCMSDVGVTTQPTSIDTAIATLGKVPSIKGEYETQAQFAVRPAAATSSAPLTMIAAPVNLDYVRFDAAAQTLQVGLYALDNRNVGYADLFGYARSAGRGASAHYRVRRRHPVRSAAERR